jgi:5,6,7,8-tetrahydromethanopterin hydro-lyase
MLYIGEGFEGGGGNAAHINLLLGPKQGPLGGAWATAAASPGPGHIPFQVVLKPNLPVKPATLFIAKAVLRDAKHEKLTWGAAQAGVAAGITRAVLDGALPPGAEDAWLSIALVWVDWNADDADSVYANNKAAALSAVQRAMTAGWPARAELVSGLASVGNPFYTPKVP